MTQSTAPAAYDLNQQVITTTGQLTRVTYITYTTKCTNCGDLCYRYDLANNTRAWGCQLRNPHATMTEGQHLDCAAGTTTVRLTCTRVGHAYQVTTGHLNTLGTWVEADHLITTSGEADARAFARAYVIGLREVTTITEPTAAPTAPAIQPQRSTRIIPRGRLTKLTPTQQRAAQLLAETGRINRGGHDGEASSTTLIALADHGIATLIWVGPRISHAITRTAA